MTNDKQTNHSEGALPRSIEEIKADLMAWKEAAPSRRAVVLVVADIRDESTIAVSGMQSGAGISIAKAMKSYSEEYAEFKAVVKLVAGAIDSPLKAVTLNDYIARYVKEVIAEELAEKGNE